MNESRRLLDRSTWTVAAVVTGVAFLLYYLTAARDIVVGDTPEFITTAVILGVPHPPGYPLFTMLGHLFSLLPFGSIPFRVNLVSVTCGALTVGVVFLTAQRLCGNRTAAAIAALALAVTPVFWRWSLVAEVFALHALLASLLVYFLIAWRAQPERISNLVLAAFVSGLACTHHHTIVLLGPAVLFVLWERRAVLRARPRTVIWCLGAFVLGLLPYAYVPWAAAHHPAYSWGDVSTLRDLLKLIARRSYGTLNLVSTSDYMGGSPWARLLALAASFGWVAGLLTLIGAVQAYRIARKYFWFALLAFFWVGPFFIWITNLNLVTAPSVMFVLERFFIFSHVVTAPLIAFGFVLLAEFIPARRLLAAAAFLAVIAMVALNYSHLDESGNHLARHFADDVFASVKPDTILLASGDDVTLPLVYEQIVEGRRPDVSLVLVPLLRGDWYLRQLRERNPNLNIPFDHYDGETNNLKTLVDANAQRPSAIIGQAPDISALNDSYRPIPRGLVNLVVPRFEAVPRDEVISAHEKIFSGFRPPAPGEARAWTFERNLQEHYALAAFRIGREHEEAGARPEARRWYQRSLVLSPQLQAAREALARVEP